jgi:hypothetical protein
LRHKSIETSHSPLSQFGCGKKIWGRKTGWNRSLDLFAPDVFAINSGATTSHWNQLATGKQRLGLARRWICNPTDRSAMLGE